MIIDLSAVASTILTLSSAAVLAAIPVVVPALLKRLHIANTSDMAAQVEAACNAAAGMAYQYAAAHGEEGLKNVDVHNQALAVAVKYVVERLPDTLKALGLTPDHIAQMVSARLGSLLATDPTITAGVPPVGPVVPVDKAQPIRTSGSTGANP